MSNADTPSNEQATYWNEEGGERWVRHIDGVEAMLEPLNAGLLAGVAARPGERVLDIGCGGGVTSAALARAVGDGGHVTGLDVSQVILEVARRRYATLANLDFLLADAGAHDFAPASYEVLTSRFGVMFFPDPHAAFANLRRALKADARLCFLCWRRLDENPWMGLAAAAAFTVLPPPPRPEPGAPGPFSFAKRERVSDILSSAGFGAIEFEALDRGIDLGSLDEAMAWLTHMGPAAQPLREANEDHRALALDAMREALGNEERNGRVVLNGATWVVKARVV
ncbi:MAG: class I SAM-dependent methyltransferase [Proteobacteria bacterium]|nr:class I SAM-dependent methyltransferase [Pseudomonadota bacterium]